MGKNSDQDTADARNANLANDHKNGEWTAADIKAERAHSAGQYDDPFGLNGHVETNGHNSYN